MRNEACAAGVMFETADGRVLFLERSADATDHPGKWCFPGGGIESGERARPAARREVLEEVGYDLSGVRLGAPIDVRNGFVTYRVLRGGPFEPTLNEEHVRAVWAHPGEAPQPLHPGVRATLDKLAVRAAPPRYQNQGVRISAAGRRLALDAKPRTLTPIRPAAPIRIKYQQRIDALVDEMADSLIYWLRAAYRADTPATVELAQDADASRVLQAAFDKLARRWLRKFDELAPRMAGWFGEASKARVDGTMQADLRRGGFTVRFKMSKAMRDAYTAVIDENVGLIRSIAEQHLSNVRVSLMQSVQNGRDLGYLTDELQKRTGITKRRAALIARDQNNKATAVMVKTRALELGITKARWVHSAGGKVPRPEHVKAGRERLVFDLAKGHDFDNGEGTVWPGTAINCFPGHMAVSSLTKIRKMWRSTFNGPMVSVQIGADLLEGTFNHPVLTARGWVPLGLLNDADQIVCISQNQRRVIADHENQEKTSFLHLFETLTSCFGYTRRTSSGFDFYGDITDGYIDEVIVPERFLTNGGEPSGGQDFKDLKFPPTDSMIRTGIFGPVHEVPPSYPASRLGKGEPFVALGMGHAGSHGRAAVSHDALTDQNITYRTGVMAGETQGVTDGGGPQSALVQDQDGLSETIPGDTAIHPDAAFTEVLGQVVRAAANRKSYVFEFGPVTYEFRGFINKKVWDFSGHVYTLETIDGRYSVSDTFVQVKNCRCIAVPIVEGFE